MPADRTNVGMGRRRQGDTEPDRSDDRNRSLERARSDESSSDEKWARGHEQGAHGEGRSAEASP